MYYCTAEWHFRNHSFSGLLHAFALKIAKNTGYFYCSGVELARYFGKNKGTIYRAIDELRKLRFFVYVGQLRDGRKRYAVWNHAEWADKHPGQCCEKGELPEICSKLSTDNLDGACIRQG